MGSRPGPTHRSRLPEQTAGWTRQWRSWGRERAAYREAAEEQLADLVPGASEVIDAGLPGARLCLGEAGVNVVLVVEQERVDVGQVDVGRPLSLRVHLHSPAR